MIKSNIGAYVKSIHSSYGTLTAASTGDATDVVGESIDRLGFDSAVVAVDYVTTLTSGKKLSMTYKIADSADNSTWSSDTILATYALITGKSGGSTASQGGHYIDIDLSAYERYVKITYYPDLNATGTDTATWMSNMILGGSDVVPVA